MKKILLLTATLCSALTITKGQGSATNERLSRVLQSYYQLKDALVAGESGKAGESAHSFIQNLNGISYKFISEGNVTTLLKDAGTIANSKSIDKQRAAFANFSGNMAAVVKGLKLNDRPVYIQYCPMKKAYWLSSEQTIKNPYYGSSMMNCGEISDTVQ